MRRSNNELPIRKLINQKRLMRLAKKIGEENATMNRNIREAEQQASTVVVTVRL